MIYSVSNISQYLHFYLQHPILKISQNLKIDDLYMFVFKTVFYKTVEKESFFSAKRKRLIPPSNH